MAKKKKEEQTTVIHGFKVFDKGMTCRGFQFEEGREYEESDAVMCEKGFHFCENPLDVLNYYNVCDSEYAAVEGSGTVVGHTEDSKKSATKLRIVAKLSLAGFIKASVDFLFQNTRLSEENTASGDSSQLAASGYYSQLAASGDYSQLAASGYSSQLAASGDYSQLAASGDSSQLAASGDYSQLAASGYSSKLAASGDSSQLAASGDSSQLAMAGSDSVGAAIGINNKIKGVIGDWITLAEWEWDQEKDRYVPVCVKSAKIDGKKIKPDTWYTLKNGKFVEA